MKLGVIYGVGKLRDFRFIGMSASLGIGGIKYTVVTWRSFLALGLRH